MNLKSIHLKFFVMLLSSLPAFAQKKLNVEVHAIPKENKVSVLVNGKNFTELIYPDSLPKPVLFPIYAPDNQIITRGFPLATRPNEPVDHPHHFGLWLNYENVNGIDFWNNSSAIPAEKKKLYGEIRLDSIIQTKSGRLGNVTYNANWQDHQKNILLKERTTYNFTAYEDRRIIDRITMLTAMQDVSMGDIKDGFLGLRVSHELELPSNEAREFTDDKGNITKVAAKSGADVTGNYLTSEGKQGDSAWGTRAKWCMLYGRKNNASISIAIIDHPRNPGYPTYWHARGYGLFAANPLGQKIFSNGKETLNFSLKKGETAVFRFRIVVASGKERLSNASIDADALEFGRIY
ncbi:MAG: PmoA family protein [Bacteroidetes bacterium]|nr:PmoA family protein [Bacteroidota bacterium]